MNIKVNHKIIKEMCGTVSFKRGDAFCRGDKVTIMNEQSDRCEAIVRGNEDFHVVIEKGGKGEVQAVCSCPSLASFQKDCQHVAAVLLTIYENQRQRKEPSSYLEYHDGSENWLSVLNEPPVRSKARGAHFENRTVIDLDFCCQLVTIKNQTLFGIEMSVNSIEVPQIREFLKELKANHSIKISPKFTYHPKIHCFEKDEADVLEELIKITQDEKVYRTDIMEDQRLLMIPPSSWEILVHASCIKWKHEGKIHDRIPFSTEPLHLQFHFAQMDNGNGLLTIDGLQHAILLDSYLFLYHNKTLFRCNRTDFQLLSELGKMGDRIPITRDQVPFFLEKVLPGLEKIGKVNIPKGLEEKLKTPLKAKLFLDRVNNILLAGLEFHYDRIVINPLENVKLNIDSMLIRDRETEELILQYMVESGFSITDSGYYLQNEELEYAFLYHVLPKMKKLVQVYATTAVRNRIIKGHAKPRIRVKHFEDKVNWLQFTFELDGIPDQEIRELLLAIQEKRKYYRLQDGALLSLEGREFDGIKEFLAALSAEEELEEWEKSLNVPILRGFGLLDSFEEDGIFTLEDSFREFLDSLRHPEDLDFEVPASLDNILRDYQKQGYKWMKNLAHYGFGGILGDSMGLGKTVQSIAYIVSVIKEVRSKKTPVLIVCPSSLTYNWSNEIMKFTPDVEALVIDGPQKERVSLQKAAREMDVLITSYPLLRRDSKWYEKQNFHTVFFDEAQAFKNPMTQTARTVKKIRADHHFALTGTPVENSEEELWSIFHVVFPELFQGLQEYSHLSRATIARRVRPFLLRRRKEDVLSELPQKIELIESSELLPDQKKLYAAYLAKLKHDTLKHLDRDTLRKNRIKILAGLTRLRQICCHPRLFVQGYKGKSAKLENLLKIVDEARASGRRVLIFSQFTKMLEIIGREFASKGLPFFYLDGETPSQERVELCDRFNNGERDYFLISLKAGGTGLNLTGADTVILYDLWWNPAVEEQAADRAHRIGQSQTVQVIKLVARGTIEEKMNELQKRKRHLIEEIIDPKEKASSTLTEEDIKEILMIT